MAHHRARATRSIVIAIVLVSALGIAVAAADETPASPPAIYLATTGAATNIANGYDGTGVTVAVIDSGVANVAGLDGKLIHQVNISSAPDAGDQYGHGTFVAGLVHQVAPGANIVSIKLSDANGAVEVTQVLAALQWVIAHKHKYGIDIVNLSFGNDSQQSANNSPLNFAVQQVWDQGMVVVASAGNAGGQPGTVTKPGDDPLIISVGSSDEKGTSYRSDDDIPMFVSRGPTQDGLAKPDLVAPGSRVESLRAPGSTIDVEHPQARVGADRFRGSGTSFSAPIVAGIVAQMLTADPTLTPNQVKYGLLKGATPINGDPAAQGRGTVRATRAVTFARSGESNANVSRSTGRGSLDNARGSAKVKVKTPVETASGNIVIVDVAVEGDHTGEVVPTVDQAPDLGLGEQPIDGLDAYDHDEFVDADSWKASQWGASQWGASQWGASQWGASTWGASTWGASTWGSSQWWASRWG